MPFLAGGEALREVLRAQRRPPLSQQHDAMADARDILGIDASAAPAGPRPRASKQSIKKPEGMSREVFALLVQDASSAAAQGISLAPTPKVSEAFKERKTRVTGWEWRAFTNQARDDGLVVEGRPEADGDAEHAQAHADLPEHGHDARGHVPRRVPRAVRTQNLGRKRVIQRRFNVAVPRARVPKKDVHGRDRSER